ncbi:MAG: HEAT repeat domain-containing protein [Roseofilum sp. Guam]|nr:HEAT repeat domain-containing protein [Roseofilum sp. Guam]MBP0030397.1 HEAT repeat domain-containing protein [Roseofilum sp. Guam]
MSDKSQQQEFLEELATEYKLYGDTRTAFLGRFATENADKLNKNLGLIWQKKPENPEQKIQDELKKIYPVFREHGCDIPETKRGRYPKGESPWELAYQWLWEVKFTEWKEGQTQIEQPSEVLNRCILGLRGNYQDAQDQLKEIAQTLQNLLKDKSLSIAKVEEGSILLILESSQTGYEQLKRLIGEKIGDFEVEYAIDEWQDVCRRMLIDRKKLTSNTVLGQVYGNRNLIDEDLFVDLALVKPKRSQNEKYGQDIDPARGSDLFARQEETVEKRFAYREFLDEIIGKRTEKQIAIIGEPGAGKTTLLQKLAFWLLQQTDDLVIWVDLAELGSQPLGEYLEEKWLKEALGKSREEIKADWEQKFKGGAVWLLLDGLDEMSQTDQQALKFRGWVTDARIIVTCRLNLWQANPSQLQGFQTYLTQPFQDEQVQEFIRRWFPGLVESGEAVQLAESLWSELQAAGKERIKDLCRNPLRLTLLCATWKVEDALPETMAELYAGFVEAMYAWKKKAFTVEKEEKKHLNAALGALAKASLEAETSRFRLTHRLVCKYFGELDEDSLVLRLGWLNEVGVAAENPREKVYGFYHATFQEYFAALVVENWDYFLPKNHVDCPVKRKRYRIFEPQWKQVILLWLGREDVRDEEKEAFVQKLVEFDDGCGEWNFEEVDRGFYEYRAYFLAAAVINEFKACSVAAQIVRQVVQWRACYLFDKQKFHLFLYPIQHEATKTITETIRQLVIEETLAIIRHCKDRNTLCLAAISLGDIAGENQHTLDALVECIENPRDIINIWDAAKSLEKIAKRNPQAIDTLIQIIENTDNENTERRMTEILEKIDPGNSRVIADFVKVLKDTEDEDICRQSAESLGKLNPGNPQAIDALIKAIENTDNENTRRQAAESLGNIDPGNSRAIAGLVKVIKNAKYQELRRQAAESLGILDPGNRQAMTALVEVIENTKNENTCRRALESLEKIGQRNHEVIACLLEIIENTKNELIQLQATKTLGTIDSDNSQVIKSLVNIIDNTKDENMCLEATYSLQEIDPGNSKVIKSLSI